MADADPFLVFWCLEQVREAGRGLGDRTVGGEMPR